MARRAAAAARARGARSAGVSRYGEGGTTREELSVRRFDSRPAFANRPPALDRARPGVRSDRRPAGGARGVRRTRTKDHVADGSGGSFVAAPRPVVPLAGEAVRARERSDLRRLGVPAVP